MDILISQLKNLVKKLPKEISNTIPSEIINCPNLIYPFNGVEYVFSCLLSEKIISLQDYINIRNNYIDRNKYLHLFEITAPRTFGETWAQNYLNEIVPELKHPSNKIDPNYSGEYDFWYNGIKIEVKASRAVDKRSGDTLIMKALSSDSDKCFDMNFQQIKPDCCDVFVWIGVWRDTIRHWVLSSNEVENDIYFSFQQHRGNIGEGQLWIKDTNINHFKQYEVPAAEILMKIEEKYLKQTGKESVFTETPLF